MSRRDQVDGLFARQHELASDARAARESAGRLGELRSWQADRLARSYADLRNDARYACAVKFFLSDLYGPQEFPQRDQELTRAWRYLKRALPRGAVEILVRAVELQVLTAELDAAMIQALAAGPVNTASYAAAYRVVGQRAARLRQIDLIISIGADMRRIVQHAWLGRLLRMAHAPAHAAGFGVLQDFLERGLAAFRAMPDAERLLQAVRERETRFLNAMLTGGEEQRAAVGTRPDSNHE
jgi:hypothetical protein